MFEPDRSESIIKSISGGLRGYQEIIWAYVFGSLARGELFQDVDLAIQVQAGAFPTLRALGGLSRDLSLRTGVEGLKVDVFDLAACPLPMVGDILRDGRQVLDRNPEARRLWEAELTIRWFDFRPVWEEQLLLRRQAKR